MAGRLRSRGRRVSVEETRDALLALGVVDPSDKVVVSAALNATLVKGFPLAFADLSASPETQWAEHEPQSGSEAESAQPPEGPKESRELESRYSPEGRSNYPPDEEGPNRKKWNDAVRELVSQVYTIRGHRHHQGSRGRIDMRHTLMLESRRLGESPVFARSIKKVTKANVLLLCDVSASMALSRPFILGFCASVRRVVPKSEVFFFDTNLEKVTRYVEASRSDLVQTLERFGGPYGGGTRIGHSLRKFRTAYGHLLSTRTTVIIVSDGWDVGDLDMLRSEMSELQRRSHMMIWINPLMDLPSYAPEVEGMRCVLPLIDMLLSPRDVELGRYPKQFA